MIRARRHALQAVLETCRVTICICRYVTSVSQSTHALEGKSFLRVVGLLFQRNIFLLDQLELPLAPASRDVNPHPGRNDDRKIRQL